jgi:acetyl-CoA acetyltransferase
LVLAEAKVAASKGLAPFAVIVSFAQAGVDPSIMGIGPVTAVKAAVIIIAYKYIYSLNYILCAVGEGELDDRPSGSV